jgi:hypothetical protein
MLLNRPNHAESIYSGVGILLGFSVPPGGAALALYRRQL